MNEKCFILKNTNTKVIDNYPIILENEKELIEYLETCNGNADEHTITYAEPRVTDIYYNLNGDLVKGDFEPIESEE